MEHGCRVTCVDARPENLAHLQTLYPGRKTHVADVQKDSLAELGNFDIVFCFGLIYHTENPIAALRNMASCCLELLLLETVVTDDPRPIFQLVESLAPTTISRSQDWVAAPAPRSSQWR